MSAARHRQFLGASRQLRIDAATVARRVTNLETSLGTRLLDRGTRGIELTAAGQELYSALHVVERELTRVAGTLSASVSISGTVRVGAPDGFGAAFLAPRLGLLAKEYPKLHIEVVALQRSFSLSRREADIAIMVGRPEHGRLIATKLTDYTLSLYASRQYCEEHSIPESPADLARHRLIGYVDDLLYSQALDYGKEFSRNWQSSIDIASATGQLEAVLGGAGIGVLHDYIACEKAQLVPVIPSLSVTRAYWIAWHENLAQDAKVQAIKEFVQNSVNSQSSGFVRHHP